MAKLVVSGWFHEIGTPKKVGKDLDYDAQDIIFVVPGYSNRMQDIERPDEPWKFDLSNEKHNMMKAKLTVYVEGYSIAATEVKPAYFGYTITIAEIEFLNVRA